MFRKGDEPIPGYRLERFLGKGQFGEVWRTTAPGGTSAALKFIDLGGKQGIKEFRGVRRVKEIRHANLMPITALWMLDGEGNVLGDKALDSYDPQPRAVQSTLQVGDTEAAQAEWLVVAMLLGKQNLADRLQECQTAGELGIPAPELLRYMEEAAKGIDYLNSPQHEFGEGPVAVQHCDIKPANIMLIGDAAVVCDFGLARVLSDAAATATGMVGSPAYMAPECIARKPGAASDQYSLAISYVELRTGQLPFHEITYLAVLEANRTGTLELSKLPPPEQLVIRKATATRPEDRYASTTEMVAALRRAVEGTGTRESTPTWVWAVAATLILVIVPITAWLGVQYWRSPNVASLRITVVPADAKVTVNGHSKPLEPDGSLAIPIRPGERVEFAAQHGDDYLPLRREFHGSQLPEGNLVQLSLEHNAVWYTKQAWTALAGDDFPAAVDAYERALQLDRTLLAPPVFELKHHQKEVRFLRSSPKGDWLISAGDDGAAAVWRLSEQGPRPEPLVLHRESRETVEGLAVAPSGTWAATGSWDDSVTVWNLANLDGGPPPHQDLAAHREDVVDVQISADGRWLLSAGLGKSLWIWRMNDGVATPPGLELSGHEVELRRIITSPDGKWLVSLDVDNHLRRWDLLGEQPATSGTTLPVPPHSVRVLAVTSSGTLLTGGDDGRIAALSLETLGEWRALGGEADSIEALAVSPDGSHVAAGHTDGHIALAPLSPAGDLGKVSELGVLGGVIHSLAWASDGKILAAGGGDGSLAVWFTESPADAAELRIVGNHGQIYQVAVTPDAKWLAASCGDGTVLVWELGKLRVIAAARRAAGGQREGGQVSS